MRGVSANVMCGQEGYFGTSAFQVLLDTERMQAPKKRSPKKEAVTEAIMQGLAKAPPASGPCAPDNLEIGNNAAHVPVVDTGGDDGYEPEF